MIARPVSPKADVIILGGGIIGVAAAVLLSEAGQKVLVLDRTGICEETSAGNAGAFAFADILPLAQKGMLRQVPRWLADPLGPLTVPPAYFPRILPWLIQFLLAGRPGQFKRALASQASLMTLAEREWHSLLSRTGLAHMLNEDGALELYETERDFRNSLKIAEVRRSFEVPFRHVARQELEQLQPGLSVRIQHATFLPKWKTVADPRKLGHALWTYAENCGATFVPGEVVDVHEQDGAVTVRTGDGRAFSSSRLVVAAGAWSRRFAARFGDPVPLETERGYNTTLPPGAFDVKRQLTFPAHGFVITPLVTGIRIGGAVELGGLRRAPNYARSRAMLAKAETFLPGLKTDNGRQWMGFRPSLPDSLPVIGPSSRSPRVFYAFGHGHLGLTQAAATARLIREFVLEQTPSIEVQPFAAARFRSKS